MSDAEIYANKQDADERAYEILCKRCGTCCGAGGADPCENLKKDACGKYFCDAYENRIGQRKTVSGNTFTCVPIRDVMTYAPPFAGCGYNK